jgi:hypothetical protein
MQKSTLTAVTMLAVAALSPTASAQTNKQIGGGMVQIDPNFPVDAAMLQRLGPVLSKMGSGYNSLTNEVLGEGGCVTGTIIPPDPGGMSSPFYIGIRNLARSVLPGHQRRSRGFRLLWQFQRQRKVKFRAVTEIEFKQYPSADQGIRHDFGDHPQ